MEKKTANELDSSYESLIVQLLNESVNLIELISEQLTNKGSNYFLESLILTLRQLGWFFTNKSSPLLNESVLLVKQEKELIKKITNIRHGIAHRESPNNFLAPHFKLVGVLNFKNADVEIQYGENKLYLVKDILAINKKFRKIFSTSLKLPRLAKHPVWAMEESRLQIAEERLVSTLANPNKLIKNRWQF